MSIYNFCAIVQYKGTNYNGWQIQNGQNGRTIQGDINQALKEITKAENIKTIGSGRTDARVHALGQVVKIEIPLSIASESLKKALNAHLSKDIRILNIVEAEEKFHPIYDASWKEYIYCFSMDETIAPFDKDLVAHYPYHLNLDVMKKGCQLFLGEHDFCNFYCMGTEVKSTIRKIFEFSLERVSERNFWNSPSTEYYIFKIKGSGFLKQMVRLIVGSLFNLGRGHIGESEILAALSGPYVSKKVGFVADPEGLYLSKVFYPSKS